LVEGTFKFGVLYCIFSLIKGSLYIFLSSFAFLPKLKKNGKILYSRIYLLVKVNPIFIELNFFQDSRSPGIIIPKTRCQ
jgi:hypothetical protein